jgi:regulatory protein
VKEETIQVKKKAFLLLARREHSVEELRAKLLLKDYNERVINEVLTDLIQENYLSDERYVEMMFRYHFGRGQGPRKIINLIRQANVNDVLIKQAYHVFEGDWFESAANQRQKKFGAWRGDIKEKSKQTRFLAGRGFEFEQIAFTFGD